MDLLDLRCFTEVAECGSFSKAAEKLYVAQPAISKRIASMEKEIGLPLFIRSSRKISLTPAGEICLKESRRTLKLFDEIIPKIKKTVTLPVTRIAYPTFFDYAMISHVVEKASQQFPQAEIDLVQRASISELHQGLSDGSIDIIIGPRSLVKDIPNIDIIHLSNEPVFAALPKDNPFSDRSSIHLSELSDFTFLCFEPEGNSSMYDQLVTMCLSKGYMPKIRTAKGDITQLFLMVVANKGVFLTRSDDGVSDIKGVQLLPIADEDLSVESVIAYHRSNENPIVDLIVSETQKYIKNQK